MADEPVKIKPAGFLLIFLVILGLAGIGVYWWKDTLFPPPGPAVVKTDKSAVPTPTPQGSGAQQPSAPQGTNPPAPTATGGTEAPDTEGITTVKEYSFVPATTLPPVKGVSAYQPLQEIGGRKVVPFPINVWAGWAPIVLANGGTAPNPNSIFAKYGVLLDLKIVDDPSAMIAAYADGTFPIGWGTLDMVPLFVERLQKDSRAMPRVFQQVDWSNGGDGIVVRTAMAQKIQDLKGKTIVLAQNSPSHYFLLSMLVNAGLRAPRADGSGGDVQLKFTADAFQAATAFVNDPSIAACVSWAPDIYRISEKVKGTKLLVSTQTANKLIADVWYARADFARDHLDLCKGIVRGIFDGMEKMKTEEGRAQAAKLLAAAYKLPEADAQGMLGDAHLTNWAENREFFMNAQNPTNFERVWSNASNLYARIGAVKTVVVFDQISDFSIIQELASVEPYKSTKDEYTSTFDGLSIETVAESNEILARVERIHFPPNSDDLNSKNPNGLPYDPNVSVVVEDVGTMVGTFGNAQIVIEGHTDASMRGKVSPQLVMELSERRANAVKQALIQKFGFNDKQILVKGLGWDKLADKTNHARNRRVEVKVYPLEQK